MNAELVQTSMGEKDLSKLKLRDEYRSDIGDIVEEFYIPCLNRSLLYSRATGYFTSDSLSIVGSGLSELITSGGKMRLIASPKLSEEDLEALQKGLEKRRAILLEKCALVDPIDDILRCRLAFLEHLVSNGLLEVKLAIPKNKKVGIYHEKIGIFEDASGNYVSFTGSNNETAGGMYNNFESCNIFCSWDERVNERAILKKQNFETMWTDTCPGLSIIDFTEETATKLLEYKKYYQTTEPRYNNGDFLASLLPPKNQPKMPPPTKFELRDYQIKAILNWFDKGGRGFFEMCTGAGKTKTAISALTMAFESASERLFVIVIAPFQHLVAQWKEELSEFNIDPITLMGNSQLWTDDVATKINEYNTGVINFVCLVSTNSSFCSEKVSSLISRIKGNFLLIADEAHNMGSERMLNFLPSNANLRIALSATPVRHFDEEGTEALLDYFGEVVVQFTLKDALALGYLTPYYYHIVPVYLTVDESIELEKLSERIEKLSLFNKDKTEVSKKENGPLEALLIKRAQLVASAENKIPELMKLVFANLSDIKNTLFYCGDGKVEYKGKSYRQIDLVTNLLGTECGLNVHKFTSDESLEERSTLKDQFVSGRLDALVAIKCLDEGVDIPKIQTAFILASTTNPKQFIQRRGRVLRKFNGKNFATIYDFLVLPETNEVSFRHGRSLIRKELNRINEFAALAVNGPEQEGKLSKIKVMYNLLDS